MQQYLTLLNNRPQFRYLWLAQVVSLFGDWFNTIATVIIVNRYADTGTAVAGLFIARALPLFVLGPVTGVIADRFNRKMILFFTDISRAIIVLGFLFVRSSDMVWLIYVLTVLQFSVSAFFEPARGAILPSLIKNDELLVANTLSSATWSAMLAFGAAIGGAAAGIFGTDTALIIDCGTFLLSAFIVLKITADTNPKKSEDTEISGGWVDMVDGFKYVGDRPNIGVVTLVKGLSQLGTADIIIALYADRIFNIGNDGAVTIGALYMSFGIGAILGPVVMNWFSDDSDLFLQRSILIGFISLPIGWLIIGIAPTLPIAMLGMFIRSWGGSVNWTYSNVLFQTKIPDRYLGRVFALDFSIFTLLMAIAVLITGQLVDVFDLSVRTVVLYGVVAYFIPIFLWAYFINSRLAPSLEPSLGINTASGQD